MLPLAHLGHHLWVLYLAPILVVLAGIFHSTLAGRRSRLAPSDPALQREGAGRDPAAQRDDTAGSPSNGAAPPGG